MFITHQLWYYYKELAYVGVIFLAHCSMVNLLTISFHLNVHVYIYITNLLKCQNTVDQTGRWWYLIDILSISTIATAKQLIQQSQNDIVSISTISTAIQLIRQSRNDIDSSTAYPTIMKRYRNESESISNRNRRRQHVSWSNNHETISNRFRRYRRCRRQNSWSNRNITISYRYWQQNSYDIVSISTISTAKQLIQQDHYDIVSISNRCRRNIDSW